MSEKGPSRHLGEQNLSADFAQDSSPIHRALLIVVDEGVDPRTGIEPRVSVEALEWAIKELIPWNRGRSGIEIR